MCQRVLFIAMWVVFLQRFYFSMARVYFPANGRPGERSASQHPQRDMAWLDTKFLYLYSHRVFGMRFL